MFVYTITIQNSLNYQYSNYDCTMTFNFLLKQALISCLATTVNLIMHPSLSSIEAMDEEQIYTRAGKGHIFPCLCLSKHSFKEGVLKSFLRAHLNVSLWTAVVLLST